MSGWSGGWALNRVARMGSQDNVSHSLREVRAEPLRYSTWDECSRQGCHQYEAPSGGGVPKVVGE